MDNILLYFIKAKNKLPFKDFRRENIAKVRHTATNRPTWQLCRTVKAGVPHMTASGPPWQATQSVSSLFTSPCERERLHPDTQKKQNVCPSFAIRGILDKNSKARRQPRSLKRPADVQGDRSLTATKIWRHWFLFNFSNAGTEGLEVEDLQDLNLVKIRLLFSTREFYAYFT